MSRYLVDKFLYRTLRNPAARQEYSADPVGYVSNWESTVGASLNEAERLTTLSFTDEERKSLSDVDFGRIFAGGAHPFLLWTLMVVIEMQRDSDMLARSPKYLEFGRKYAEGVRVFGRPDIST